MNKEKREIRKLLLGKTVLDEDGRLTTPESGTFRVPQGVMNGAASVRFLGVSGKSRRYETKLSQKDMTETAEACMQEVGRAVRLREQPDAVGCLIRYMLTRPVLLIFRYIEDAPVLTAWTGRGMFGWVSQRRAIHSFEQLLPEDVLLSAAPPPEPPEKKKRRKGEEETQEKRSEPEEEAEEAERAEEESSDWEYYDDTGEWTEDEAAWAEGENAEWAEEDGAGWPEDGEAQDWTEEAPSEEEDRDQ